MLFLLNLQLPQTRKMLFALPRILLNGVKWKSTKVTTKNNPAFWTDGTASSVSLQQAIFHPQSLPTFLQVPLSFFNSFSDRVRLCFVFLLQLLLLCDSLLVHFLAVNDRYLRFLPSDWRMDNAGPGNFQRGTPRRVEAAQRLLFTPQGSVLGLFLSVCRQRWPREAPQRPTS